MGRPTITVEEQAAIWVMRGRDRKSIEETASLLEISTRTVHKYCDVRTATVLRLIFHPPLVRPLTEENPQP